MQQLPEEAERRAARQSAPTFTSFKEDLAAAATDNSAPAAAASAVARQAAADEEATAEGTSGARGEAE